MPDAYGEKVRRVPFAPYVGIFGHFRQCGRGIMLAGETQQAASLRKMPKNATSSIQQPERFNL
jgi:hypothetical protein